MSGGDVAVATPMDPLNRRSSQSTPSRKTILSRITGGGGDDSILNPVSNTDAILRKRSVSNTGSQNSGSTKGRRSRSGTKQRNGSVNGYAENGTYTNGNGQNGDVDNDNQSDTSARGVISSFIQRSRSRSSADPEGPNDGARKSRRPSKGKMGMRMPNFNKNSTSPTEQTASPTRYDEGEEEIPPVPSIHQNGNEGAVSKERDIPRHPSQKRKGSSKSVQKEDAGEQQQGYLGGAMAAVAGVGAAVAGKVTGGQGQSNGSAKHDVDSEDEFHDADDAEPELDDIAEEHEDAGGEQQQRQQQQKQKKKPEKKISQSSATKKGAAAAKRGRNRGLSEGEGLESKSKAERGISPESNGRESMQSTNDTVGSKGGKRRSGSTPAMGNTSTNTENDQKAKKETPAYVREKAARVKKLTLEDVQMDEREMQAQIKEARRALHLFLNSRMIEAEEIMAEYADKKLYYALGDALIAVIKGFMTFEPVDLAKAISYCKDSLYMASLLRKPTNIVASFGRFARGTGPGPSAMAGMNIVQRHAELIYAESLLLKAVMGILYSGDFIAFVSEALNMRNAYGIYRSLQKYVSWADKKAGGTDDSIDEDFRSGVYLGNGLISLILGLLPGKVLKIMEVIGYTGDTQVGLETLALSGQWSKNKSGPGMKVEEEGIRRQVCDMGIMLYHLVISTFIPVTGVDIDYADKILHYNLDRYPEGVFFLYFSGRLYSTQARAEKAIVQYRSARDIQKEYVQLQHICYWDMALCHMSLTQWKQASECFEILYNDSNWSKCVYSYGRAANMYMIPKKRSEAEKMFEEVPGKMQRIAGKSIPMEKYCSRKAQKFTKQRRLLLPAIEFSYIYHCLTNAPRYSLCDNQLVDISEALREINEVEDPSQYHGGADEYWDDYCLAHFLRGVTLRYIAYPEKHAKVQPEKSPIPQEEASEQAEISINNVIEASHRIAMDHYLCYFAHYELGRLRANQGRKDEAREQFNLIMNGKALETKPSKGKYSMQNMCTLRSNGALAVL